VYLCALKGRHCISAICSSTPHTRSSAICSCSCFVRVLVQVSTLLCRALCEHLCACVCVCVGATCWKCVILGDPPFPLRVITASAPHIGNCYCVTQDALHRTSPATTFDLSPVSPPSRLPSSCFSLLVWTFMSLLFCTILAALLVCTFRTHVCIYDARLPACYLFRV